MSAACAVLIYGLRVVRAEWEPPDDLAALWSALGCEGDAPEEAEFLGEAASALGLDAVRTEGGPEGDGSVILVGVEYGSVEGAGTLDRAPTMPPAEKLRRIELLRGVCGLDAPGWQLGAWS